MNSVPSYKKTEVGLDKKPGKPTPDSGYYLVNTKDLCKTYQTGSGRMAKPRPNGQWYLPYAFDNGWSGHIFVDHVVNDDGSPRNLEKPERTEGALNRLCASAGVDDLSGVQNTRIAVKWQDASYEAYKAGARGRIFPIPMSEYEQAIAEGWTVEDIGLPNERAAQSTGTTTPATTTDFDGDDIPF